MKRFSLKSLFGERIDLPLAATRPQEALYSLCMVTPCARLADVKTVIVGHCNAAPLYRWLVPEKAETHATIETGLKFGLGGLHSHTHGPDYLTMVRRLGRKRNVAIVWNGNQANADFLLAPGRPFDFVPRGYPDTSVLPGSQVVPEALVRAHLKPFVDPLDQLLADLGRPDGLLRIVVGIQAPLADNALIRKRLHHEPHYARRAADFGVDIDTVPITAASVRHKLWFTLMAMYREIAERHNAPFIDTAPEACDENGFLQVKYAADDVTHAGGHYGELMVERLAAALPH